MIRVAAGLILLLGPGCLSRSPSPLPEAAALDVEGRRLEALNAWARGLQQRSRGDFPAALRSFQEAARLDPESSAPQREVGRMLLSVGQFEAAQPFLEAARVPGDARGLMELAHCRRRLGDHPGAIETLAELHALQPRQKLPLIQLHALLLLEGRAAEGLVLFTRAAAEGLPDWPFVHEALGDFRLRGGELDGALQSYREASKLGGETESLQRKTALALRRITARDALLPGLAPADPGLGLAAPEGAAGPSGAALRGGGP